MDGITHKEGLRRRLAVLMAAFLFGGVFVAGLSFLPGSLPSDVLRLESIGAEILYLDASEIVKRGPGAVFVLRFNDPVQFVPRHFKAEGIDGPIPVDGWLQQIDAPVVFNAGQFDEHLNHLGWLKSNDVWLSRHRKESWLGLFLSGPKSGQVWARIADTQYADASVVQDYRHALQSMMLFDHEGKTRVRDSSKTASRAVLAEDRQGRILFILTQGAVTLADLARWLSTGSLGLVRAMNLDGGVEAQVAINTTEVQLNFYGQYGTGTTALPAGSGFVRYPLPAVVGVYPMAPETKTASQGAP